MRTKANGGHLVGPAQALVGRPILLHGLDVAAIVGDEGLDLGERIRRPVGVLVVHAVVDPALRRFQEVGVERMKPDGDHGPLFV